MSLECENLEISVNGTATGFLGSANPSTSQPRWYFTCKEIEENTPSRRDGVNLTTETKIRKCYCKLLQDLGKHLHLPQETITTAIIFCQRFFLYQSLVKNDFKAIAIACLLLATKTTGPPRSLEEITNFSFVMIHKKDPVAALRIKQKEVLEQEEELIRRAELLVLDTLNCDFNVALPYPTLVSALKKFDDDASWLAPTAWSLLRHWLQTSLYTQFEPHCLAVAALHFSSVILKNWDISDMDIGWIEEFNVTYLQFTEIWHQVEEMRDLSNIVV
ncbi:CDK9 kinase-activating protein cyclin T protein [Dioscorea alata]|uniref:CDK9 kinase-activating protein cyclin T protein n=1 Tax=Dioscorea alata TaxID=55571 RepID=A0ACB7W7J3_DIOAL|nr:CDK9 kinase-activating protein cyclin T protein [Dioscorea alata]